MTDEATTTTTETAATEKEARERRSFPVRILTRTSETTYTLDGSAGGVQFADIASAERWVRQHGADGTTYLLARTIGLREVEPRRIKEGVL